MKKRVRPPKTWWYRCVDGVAAGGRQLKSAVHRARRICGALWYRKMSDKQRAKAKRKYR